MSESPSDAVAVRLPSLGTTAPLVVTSWFVSPGESVDAGERLLEVLMPGVAFCVAAPVSGVLRRVELPADAVAVPGDILGWIQP